MNGWFSSSALRHLRLAILLAAIAGPVAACTGSGSAGPPATPSAAAPSASRGNHLNGTSSQNRAAFAKCMQTNGVPNFPTDFGAKGAVQAAGVNVHSAAYQSAVRACAADLR